MMASFEQQIEELEKVVQLLERGDLPLEDSVALFERGMHLSNACKTQLSSAESRVQVLIEPGQSREPRVEALDIADDDELEENDES
jgi:exodeoxyribonuclease VII small subunit